MKNCEYCGKSFEAKRANHKYCKTSCRVKAHRERNNLEEPAFLKTTPKVSSIGKVREDPPYPTDSEKPQNIAIRDFAKDIRMLESQLKYWQGVIDDLKHGIVPAGTIAGSFIGAAASREDDLSNFGLGMIIGAAFDKIRERTIHNQAVANIQAISGQIEHLKQAKQSFKLFENKNLLSKPSGRSRVRTILSAEEYKKAEIPELKFTGQWKYLIGNPQHGFHMMLHGKPGNGKTSFALQFADYFDRVHGKVLYLTAEQTGLNKAFQGALNRFAPNAQFNIHTKPPNTTRELIKSIRDFDLAVLDSVDHLGLDWDTLKEIKEKSPKTALLTIHHSTKAGAFKGGQELEHECDISIQMDNFIARQTKSRFAAPADLELKEV